MKKEAARELLEKFQDYWNGECYDDAILPSHIDSFLSTLPEEKEEICCTCPFAECKHQFRIKADDPILCDKRIK